MSSFQSHVNFLSSLLSEFDVSIQGDREFTLVHRESGKAVSYHDSEKRARVSRNFLAQAYNQCKEHFPQAAYLNEVNQLEGINLVRLKQDWDTEFAYKVHVALRKISLCAQSAYWWNFFNSIPPCMFSWMMGELQLDFKALFTISEIEPYGQIRRLNRVWETISKSFRRSLDGLSYALAQEIIPDDCAPRDVSYVRALRTWVEDTSSKVAESVASQLMGARCIVEDFDVECSNAIVYYDLCDTVDDWSTPRDLPAFVPVSPSKSESDASTISPAVQRAAASFAKHKLGMNLMLVREHPHVQNQQGQWVQLWDPVRDDEQTLALARLCAVYDPQRFDSIVSALEGWVKQCAQSGDPYAQTRAGLVAYLASGQLQVPDAEPSSDVKP